MATGVDAKGRPLLTKPLSSSASNNPEKFSAIQAVLLVDQQGNPVTLQAGSGSGTTPDPVQTQTVVIPENTGQVHVDATPETSGRTAIISYSASTGDGISYKVGQVWAVRTLDSVSLTHMEFGGFGPEMALDFFGHLDPDTGDMEILVDNIQPDSQVCSLSFFKRLLP